MGVQARLLAGIPVGVVATLTMDAAMVAAARIGGGAFESERTDLAVIGRWAGGMLRGRWRHVDASSEDPVLPLFVLFPSRGYGPAGLRSGEAARLARIMLVGHTAFGAGIGMGTALLVTRRR